MPQGLMMGHFMGHHGTLHGTRNCDSKKQPTKNKQKIFTIGTKEIKTHFLHQSTLSGDLRDGGIGRWGGLRYWSPKSIASWWFSVSVSTTPLFPSPLTSPL